MPGSILEWMKRGNYFFWKSTSLAPFFIATGLREVQIIFLNMMGLDRPVFSAILFQKAFQGITKRKKYSIKGNSIAGYGIYAVADIAPNELIFKGEETTQRIVTRRYVHQNWNVKEKETFRKYAYPLSKEVFLLWDYDPTDWAPQNHSCNPNTTYDGLNVISLRQILAGEELTLDYASFLDENMEPFNCQCGNPDCRGLITGITNNSVTERELLAIASPNPILSVLHTIH